MSDWDSGQVMPNNEAAFDKAMEQLQVTANQLAVQWTNDPAVRLRYSQGIAAMSSELKMQARLGHLSWAQAAQQANLLRNELMELARRQTTPIGKAWAEQRKLKGKTLNELVANYTVKLHGKNADFTRLTSAQQNQVYAHIVERSGVSDQAVNIKLKRWVKAGRALWILSISLSVYNVATAQDKTTAALHEARDLGVGLAGGMAGGAIAGLMCGPGAPVCVTVGVFVGGALAVLGVQAF
jgi:hypothetical protein